MWVADLGNNRVLEFVKESGSFANGQAASLVIGQSSFTSSVSALSKVGLHALTAIAFDPSGNLWVADLGNNRVLKFDIGSGFTDGEPASLVLGQSSFTSGAAGLSATKFNYDDGLAVDSSGNVWVSDSLNRRILEFVDPTTNGQPAALVIGQNDFTTGTSGSGQTGLADPAGIAFDPSGNLWGGGLFQFQSSRVSRSFFRSLYLSSLLLRLTELSSA